MRVLVWPDGGVCGYSVYGYGRMVAGTVCMVMGNINGYEHRPYGFG